MTGSKYDENTKGGIMINIGGNPNQSNATHGIYRGSLQRYHEIGDDYAGRALAGMTGGLWHVKSSGGVFTTIDAASDEFVMYRKSSP